MKFSYNEIRWVILLSALGIVSLILWNTNVFFDKFKTLEREKMEIWATAQTEFMSSTDELNQGPLILQIFQSNKDTPMILVNKDQSYWVNNMDESILNQPDEIAKKITEFINQNKPILLKHNNALIATLYYGDAPILNKLKYYPLGLLLILILFSAILYFYMKSVKASEQNKLWAGMAKETAHQIATPLSAIMGWSNLLKSKGADPQITQEMDQDIERLHLITDRFSKIGASPKLSLQPLLKTTKEGVLYLKKRLPNHIELSIDDTIEEQQIALNKALYFWCLENIIKNAIDAMQGSGSVELSFKSNELFCYVYVKDQGPGIPQNKIKAIFKPGYSTKTRGWGLGLSLAKRIIEEYHNGKISVIETSPKGTVFELKFRKGVATQE